MPTAIQIITYKIHGQRKLLVPSILLRRGYLATAHLGQIESEMQALQSRGVQVDVNNPSYKEDVVNRLEVLPNYDNMTRAEIDRHTRDILNYDARAFSGRMNRRMAHLKAVKKNIIQFKLIN